MPQSGGVANVANILETNREEFIWYKTKESIDARAEIQFASKNVCLQMEREHERCLPAGGRSEEQPAGLHPQPGHSVRLHLLPGQLQPRDWSPLRLHHPAGRPGQPGQPPTPLLHPKHLGRLIQGTQIAAFVLNDGGILSDSVEI